MITTTYDEVKSNKCTLSASQLGSIIFPNKNFLFVRDFLTRKLATSDKGTEVGSMNYLYASNYYFIKAKSLQQNDFLPTFNGEGIVPIRPPIFVDNNLKEGDVIISKDSNIGEVVVLDKDYPNYMLSSALYKLPLDGKKYYLIAFLKSHLFRDQLESKVPRGATISHAKTIFLDCKIPLPNQGNKNEVIRYVESLTRSIINKEKEIQAKHYNILNIIDIELKENQKKEDFRYDFPKLEELERVGRLDTARYTQDYKIFDFLLRNYKYGVSNLTQLGYDVTRGQNLQESAIGKSIYSDAFVDGFYKLAVSTNFSEYSTLDKYNYLGNTKKLKEIKKGDIIFSCRGSQFGRVIIFCDDLNRTITNIDNVHISKSNYDLEQSIFITLWLNFLRGNKHIYKIAHTGSGANSLTQYQFDETYFPNFTDIKKREVVKEYYTPIAYPKIHSLDEFLELDSTWNKNAGLYQIDRSLKATKNMLLDTIERIARDQKVTLDFSSLYSCSNPT
jgi:hypothetical protein